MELLTHLGREFKYCALYHRILLCVGAFTRNKCLVLAATIYSGALFIFFAYTIFAVNDRNLIFGGYIIHEGMNAHRYSSYYTENEFTSWAIEITVKYHFLIVMAWHRTWL